MNISGISSTQSFQVNNVSGNRSENQLSDEQKDLVSSLLEGYDSDNLSQEDAMEIVSSFQAAGISPSRDLANSMADAGFSASEVGDLAGVAGTPPQGGMPPPPPPPQNSEEETTISSLLETLLNSDEDDESTATSYESISDYTSRIMSLTQEVKEQVRELFETYKPENTELNAQEASKVVINSLSQILSDSNNYKNTSYYA